MSIRRISQLPISLRTCLNRPCNASRILRADGQRWLSTLRENCNPHIYVFSDTTTGKHILSLLQTDPPTRELAIGTTSSMPPTPSTFEENPKFMPIVQAVLKQHSHQDPGIQAQAQAFASQAGSTLGSGGMFFPQSQSHRQKRSDGVGDGNKRSGDGAGGASSQGGAGGGGRGGYVHLSDSRAPPDYGRIAWPEDIFGSLEVDGQGGVVLGEDGRGLYEVSGSYRVCTREGILGLSEFLNGKVVERLKKLEGEVK